MTTLSKREASWPEPFPRRLLDLFRWPDWAAFDEDLKVEEFREGDEHVVRVEAPGLDPEHDIDVDVRDGTLRVAVERRQETKTEEKGRFHSEFRYGAFSRVLPLPPGAGEEDVKAAYRDGILEVRVPMIPQGRAETHKVPIQHL